MLKRVVILAAVLVCVLAIVVLVLLPPRSAAPASTTFSPSSPVARGGFHVHSARSDGTGTLDDIARAAADAGLSFVIITDHGDGTREPEPPAYRSGVLCIDGVEISTQHGHYVALGLSRTPYPLGGHPREVIEDVRRFGGFGFAAHPGSPKAALRWDDWEADFDGIEWLNADSEWRDESWGALVRGVLTYGFRPPETLAGLLDRPEAVLKQWEKATATRRVAAIAGADAHERLGLGQGSDPYEDYIVARVPAYEVSFRGFVNHVLLDRPLSGDARVDAPSVLAAIREGRMFTSIDGLARLSAFEVVATSGPALARAGEYLDPQGGPVVIEARVAAPPGTTLVLSRNGEVLHEVASETLRIVAGTEPGAYRIEAHLPPHLRSSSSVPWILANPIYVAMRETHERAAISPPSMTSDRAPIALAAGGAEASDGSSSTLGQGGLDDGTPALEWRFKLRDGDRQQQYAAMRFPVGRLLTADDRLRLWAKSDAPRRIWAQLRAPTAQGGDRWGATFYVGTSLRSIDLRLADFRALGPVGSERPAFDRVDSLLLVIDTLNTWPGTQGVVWISDLWFAR